MKNTVIFSILFAALIFLNVGTGYSRPVPDASKGWFAAGSHPKDYKMEIVSSTHHSGSKAAMIQYSASTEPAGFGTYMQMHQPGAWAGKKLKMTGYIKTVDISSWCGMWCRVDGADGKEMMDFDNMGDRPIKGTTDWTKYEIIVNVPKDASAIAYGILVDGKGTAYFDDVNFEVLGAAEAGPHNKNVKAKLPDEPANLNFEN